MWTARKSGTFVGAVAGIALLGGCAQMRDAFSGEETAQVQEPVYTQPSVAETDAMFEEEARRAQLAQAEPTMRAPSPRPFVTRNAPLSIGSEGIRTIQQQLNQQGYDIAVDGIWGPETSGAVRQFQQQQGLEPTGSLTLATLGEMGLDIQQLAEADQGGQGQQATMPGAQQQQQQQQQGGQMDQMEQ